MWLASLEIHGLRCLREVPELKFHPEFNLITGANAAGKTTLLEAIDLLARARSFRTRQARDLISHGADQYVLRGQVATGREADDARFYLSQSRSEDKLELRKNNDNLKKLAEIACCFAAQVIHPDSHDLICGAPSHRRAWLDWGVFHVEPGYAAAWSRYRTVLRQRNAALKSRQEPTPWDSPLIEFGNQLDQWRQGYLEAVENYIQGYVQRLLPGAVLETTYHAGFNASCGLAESLAASLEASREQGHTTVGPHRADIRLRLSGAPAAREASRGQMKLLSCCLLLAQVALFQELRDETCVLLFDDLTAELDGEHQQRLVEALSDCEAQIFTSRTGGPIEALPEGAQGRVFHVEHGAPIQTAEA